MPADFCVAVFAAQAFHLQRTATTWTIARQRAFASFAAITLIVIFIFHFINIIKIKRHKSNLFFNNIQIELNKIDIFNKI
jgi:hypothetical protein